MMIYGYEKFRGHIFHLPRVIFCPCHSATHSLQGFRQVAFLQKMFILSHHCLLVGQVVQKLKFLSVKSSQACLFSQADIQIIIPRDEPTMSVGRRSMINVLDGKLSQSSLDNDKGGLSQNSPDNAKGGSTRGPEWHPVLRKSTR